MARKIAVAPQQASTLDILNVIRQNASSEYQNLVPEITKAEEICKVGDVFQGYPAIANQFINALVNRIALVYVKSRTYKNPYERLKKGYLEYGETVEEIFVNIAKVRTYNVEEAAKREFQRTMPDVRTAFHIMNWRVQYPVTVQEQDLYQAFLSLEGVTNLISNIVDQVYTAAEYDEYLLFKYLIIKAVSHGRMKPISIGNGTDPDEAAIAFRATSNQLTFMHTDYNEDHVLTNTPRDKQVIFMDSAYNAQYDVKVLAAAFNMEKAEFMGSLFLIDDFTSFDNARFEQIGSESDMIDPVTADELTIMANVKAVMVDEDWFQIYDNNNKFTETYVGSGMYWNYFYNVWKTVSISPFSNAVAFVEEDEIATLPIRMDIPITDKTVTESNIIITLSNGNETSTVDEANKTKVGNYTRQFVQSEKATENGIAVHKYGAIIFPKNATATKLQFSLGGKIYESTVELTGAENVGDVITFNPIG